MSLFARTHAMTEAITTRTELEPARYLLVYERDVGVWLYRVNSRQWCLLEIITNDNGTELWREVAA